jgi:hypothetical protein
VIGDTSLHEGTFSRESGSTELTAVHLEEQPMSDFGSSQPVGQREHEGRTVQKLGLETKATNWIRVLASIAVNLTLGSL